MDNYWSLTLISGGILALFLALYLLLYPARFLPNKLLGGLVFAWALTVLMFNFKDTAFFLQYPKLYGTADFLVLCCSPLMFLYVKYYIKGNPRMHKRELGHFVPALSYLLVISPMFFIDPAEKTSWLLEGFPEWYLWWSNFFNLFIIFQWMLYAILSLNRLQSLGQTEHAPQRSFTYKWLSGFLAVNILLWIIGTSGAVLELIKISAVINMFQLFYSGLTISALGLSIFAITKPKIFNPSILQQKPAAASIKNHEHDPLAEPAQNPQKAHYEMLHKILTEQKLYLKTDLKMQDLCAESGLSYKRISEAFNGYKQQSFHEIINQLRLQEALSLISQDFHRQYTLPHLAEMAGFNSKTTFNRIFKKQTGLTPTEYIQNNGG